jgi:hypothetical protein
MVEAKKGDIIVVESGEEGDSEEDLDKYEPATDDESNDEHVLSSKRQTSASPEAEESRLPAATQSSVVEDVIGKKGVYGRFAQDWFSRRGWSMDKRKMQGMSSDETAPIDETLDQVPVSKEEIVLTRSENGNDLISTLLPKLLRTTRILLSSGNFYFSYDHDITRSLGNQSSISKSLSLWKRVDPLVRPIFQFAGASQIEWLITDSSFGIIILLPP